MFTAPPAEVSPAVFASKTAGVLISEPPNVEAAEIWRMCEGRSSTCVCLATVMITILQISQSDFFPLCEVFLNAFT